MEDHHKWVPRFDDDGSGALDIEGMEHNDHWWGMESHHCSMTRTSKGEGQRGTMATVIGAIVTTSTSTSFATGQRGDVYSICSINCKYCNCIVTCFTFHPPIWTFMLMAMVISEMMIVIKEGVEEKGIKQHQTLAEY